MGEVDYCLVVALISGRRVELRQAARFFLIEEGQGGQEVAADEAGQDNPGGNPAGSAFQAKDYQGQQGEHGQHAEDEIPRHLQWLGDQVAHQADAEGNAEHNDYDPLCKIIHLHNFLHVGLAIDFRRPICQPDLRIDLA